MKALSILENTNYRNKDILYLKNVRISEWDIHSAGLAVIKYYKLLPEAEIQNMENMEKHARTVREGNLQRENKELAKKILDGLANVRKAFAVANHINENQILAIKKDALFLINSVIQNPNIKDSFEFREKGKYTSYIVLSGKEFYLKLDGTVDVKGISDISREKQKKYFLKDIANFLKSAERINQDGMFQMLKSYRTKYLTRQLPIETYRDLNTGCFHVGKYMCDSVSDDMINDIDISQNYLNFIVPLISLVL